QLTSPGAAAPPDDHFGLARQGSHQCELPCLVAYVAMGCMRCLAAGPLGLRGVSVGDASNESRPPSGLHWPHSKYTLVPSGVPGSTGNLPSPARRIKNPSGTAVLLR